jgi:hypothetical protein
MNRNEEIDLKRLSAVIKGFIESVMIKDNNLNYEEVDIGLALVYITLAESLISKVRNTNNTKFVLKSSDDLELNLCIGIPRKIIVVSIENHKLCYS